MNKNDRNSNNISIQWLIPIVALMVFLVVTLVKYNNTMLENAKNKAMERISKQAVSVAGYYNGLYTGYSEVASALADHFVDSEDIFEEENVSMLEDICKTFRLTNAYIVKSDESAIDEQGNEMVKVDNSAEFKSLIDSKTVSLGMINEKGNVVLAFSAPIRTTEEWKGNVVFILQPDRMTNIIDSTAYSYSLILANGLVAENVGAENGLFKVGENIKDVVDTLTFEEGTKMGFIQSMDAGRSGNLIATNAKGTKRYMTYQPIGRTGGCILVAVQENQISKSIDDENSATRVLILKILISIGMFITLVLLVYIINRVGFAKQSKELRNKAETDLLTDLLNKISTERKIIEYLEGEGKNKTNMMCVLDIDNFKKINDTMGHAFGDEVLATFGKRIRSEFRVTDIVGRTGGDEFIIFLKDLKDDAIIEREAGRVASFFKDFQVGTYTKYSPTASIGAAIYPRDATDYDSLYKSADTALYKAKKRGKNQLAFYRDITDEDKKAAEEAKKPKDVEG